MQEKHSVRWDVHRLDGRGDQAAQPEHRIAGPFADRKAAEKFAAGLAETIGPRLGNVTIDTVADDGMGEED